MRLKLRNGSAMWLLLLAGCGGAEAPPPPTLLVEELPVSGSREVAANAGFTRCVTFTTDLRCRKDGVRVVGEGPFSAAVDVAGRDGEGGFDHLVVWHDSDQTAVFAIGYALDARGWRSCLVPTPGGGSGDQKVWTRDGAPVRYAMDISFWGKRRMRVIPEWWADKPAC